MLQLATTTVASWALGGGPKMPLGGSAPMRQLTTFGHTAPAAAALVTVFPTAAMADDGGIVDTLINGGLTVIILGFVAFIGSVSVASKCQWTH